jgi:2'-hydroxyisoflavone reductase
MRGMLEGIRGALKADARFTWAAADFLDAQKVSPWGDMPVWIPADGDSAGFARRSIKKALARGLSFRPFGATAVDTLAWFKAQPAERQAKLRAGISPEREKELLALWKARG